MSLVAKLLPAQNVLPDLAASSKKRLFEQVGLLFENQHGISRTVVFDSRSRERLARPGWAGAAIPHGASGGLKRASAFVRHLNRCLSCAGRRHQLVSRCCARTRHRKHQNPVEPAMFSDRAPQRCGTGDAAALPPDHSGWQPDAAVNVRSCMTTTAMRFRCLGSRARGRTAVRRESAAAAAIATNLTHPNSVRSSVI
jgi:ribosomal protein L35